MITSVNIGQSLSDRIARKNLIDVLIFKIYKCHI